MSGFASGQGGGPQGESRLTGTETSVGQRHSRFLRGSHGTASGDSLAPRTCGEDQIALEEAAALRRLENQTLLRKLAKAIEIQAVREPEIKHALTQRFFEGISDPVERARLREVLLLLEEECTISHLHDVVCEEDESVSQVRKDVTITDLEPHVAALGMANADFLAITLLQRWLRQMALQMMAEEPGSPERGMFAEMVSYLSDENRFRSLAEDLIPGVEAVLEKLRKTPPPT
ncbi:hypothetical protein [Nocardia asteroides]|uniref:hypothetical protein n=1 Tax=Nocardia asteroides TaxID=1824 RepID=UPI0033C50D0F